MYDDILAFFKKIIKPRKKEPGEGDGGDDDDEYDPDELDEDEDDEENEASYKFNQEEHKIDDIERLRDTRIELYNEKQGIESAIAGLETERRKLESKENETKKELEDTEDMIQDFQKEKMDKLNQLNVSILLKISQIQNLEMNPEEYEKWKKYRDENQPDVELGYDHPGMHGYGSPSKGGNLTSKGRDANMSNHFGQEFQQPIEEDYRGYFLPNQLKDSTLFSHENLLCLIDRKRELDQEDLKNKETLKKQKEAEKAINKKIKVNQALKKEKEEEYNEKQMLRFGDIVDLDSLEVSGPSQAVIDLRNTQLKVEKLCMKRREDSESDLEQTQRDLTRSVKENTGLLELIIDLGKQQIDANEKLDMTKAAILEDENAEQKKLIIREKEDLREVIQLQSRKIETLKTEINLYKRKGGHIYTKVTTNRRHANMTQNE